MVMKRKFTALSYKSGRRLGKFSSLKEVFKKFPSEKVAFDKVKRFNRKTGRMITTTKQIPMAKKTMKITRRWDR